MLDKSYFESEFHRQLQAVDGMPVVRLSMNGGREETWVRAIEEFHDGYVTLVVYRPKGAGSYANKDGQGTHFPAAISYDAIDAVWFSNTTKQQHPQVGFFWPQQQIAD